MNCIHWIMSMSELHLAQRLPKAIKSSGFFHLFYPLSGPERLPEREYEGHFSEEINIILKNWNVDWNMSIF